MQDYPAGRAARAAVPSAIASARLGPDARPCVLILDDQGRICAYELAAATLFGNTQDRLLGRRISELVDGILVDGDSPDSHAKRLRHLCTANEWRHCVAHGFDGRRLAVAIHLSIMTVDNQEVFLLEFQGKTQ